MSNSIANIWRCTWWVLCLSLGMLLGACGDSDGGGDPAGSTVDTGSRGGGGRQTDSGGSDGSGTESDAASGEDGASTGSCRSGDRRCDDDTHWAACNVEGDWVVEACPTGSSCVEPGACFTDRGDCQAGERTCLEGTLPAVCDPGNGWTELDPCEADQACVAGECRSRTCAAAASSASYIGCDYLAAALPNVAFANTPGGTPDAPLGVVLANSSDRPASITVFDANDAVATLIGEVTVAVPNIPGLPSMSPVTVRTEIRDGDGALVGEGLTRAESATIPPHGMAVILLPNVGSMTETVVRRQVYRIRSEEPVAAYQFSPYCCNYSFSNDASLLLPIPTWGNDYRFVGVPSWNQSPNDELINGAFPGSSGTLTVMTNTPNTEVRVELPPGGEVMNDATGRVQLISGQATALVQPGEALHLFAAPAQRRSGQLPLGVDLSGARVITSAPVAVFSGHECTFYPQEPAACDHLEEQLFPTDTWGQEFTVVPPVLRTTSPATATEATYWKFVADRPDTRISLSVPFSALSPVAPGFEGVPNCGTHLDGDRTIVLGAGEHCEFGTRRAFHASADAPIAVMGVISGQNTTGFSINAFGQHAGDPAIFLVPPERQYRNDYAFLAPTTYFNDYLTVVTTATATVTLDGATIDMSDATAIAGSTHVFKHIVIEDGPHSLQSSAPAGILVFAFDDFVSYAFTGGLNLIKSPD